MGRKLANTEREPDGKDGWQPEAEVALLALASGCLEGVSEKVMVPI